MPSSTWLSGRLALLLWGSGRPGGSSTTWAPRLSPLLQRRHPRAPSSCSSCLLRRRCLSTFQRGPSPEKKGLPPPPAAAPSVGFPRSLGTHPKKEPIEALNTAQGARDFIYSLHSTERSCLLRELHRFESIAIAQASRFPKPLVPFEMPMKQVAPPEPAGIWEKLEVAPPSTGQLKHVFFHNAIPFVGFGFFDNAIMIAAGTQIELSIGIVFGISTMAAAALGNLVSDLAGLGLAGYVEAMASRLGLSIPDLTPKQADMWQTRLSAHLGKAVGVTIGCLLGMFPLFFFGDEEEKKLEEKN
ncbi:transmembrane protein 65 isoform X1 [Hemicordylus capensis]|uniref:transmembrane protein 65 isoform X1 n=1 Tax=Hemicordylus capensis TaxID=884348 RepID=UPI002304B4BC|nr:transmembrane protein 65 isoform X1 [Hemicordylus capensis]